MDKACSHDIFVGVAGAQKVDLSEIKVNYLDLTPLQNFIFASFCGKKWTFWMNGGASHPIPWLQAWYVSQVLRRVTSFPMFWKVIQVIHVNMMTKLGWDFKWPCRNRYTWNYCKIQYGKWTIRNIYVWGNVWLRKVMLSCLMVMPKPHAHKIIMKYNLEKEPSGTCNKTWSDKVSDTSPGN